MPRHFVDLTGAAALPNGHFQMTARIVRDLVAHAVTGVVHGPAGTGKTFAVEAALEALDALEPLARPRLCVLTFPARPTIRMIADQLLRELTGTENPPPATASTSPPSWSACSLPRCAWSSWTRPSG